MAKKFDVIVVGELNVDLILNQIDGFPKVGTEILADELEFTLGSSSAICASNLSSLGLKVAFMGKLGNDFFGQFIIGKLKEKGVDTSMIIIDEKLKTGATIALSYDEDRAMVTHQGAMSYFGLNDIDEANLRQADHLHFSSYFFQQGFKYSLGTLFSKAKAAGLTISLDIQWDPSGKWDFDLENVLPLVDIFIPNEIELQKLTKKPNLESAIRYIQNISELTIIKCGNRGSVLCYDNKKIEKGAFVNKKIVDTVGAGDSFNSGYISKFLKGKSPEECQIFGNLIGAISTTRPGGTKAFESLEKIMKIAKEKFNYTESMDEITGKIY